MGVVACSLWFPGWMGIYGTGRDVDLFLCAAKHSTKYQERAPLSILNVSVSLQEA